jgi:uncharacterized secreted protein with C-terminal beta-propeller domain
MPTKFNLKYLAAFGLVIVLVVTGSLIYILRNQTLNNPNPGNTQNNNLNALTGTASALAFDQFKSCDDIITGIEGYYKDNQNNYGGGIAVPMMSSSVAKDAVTSAAPTNSVRTGGMEASTSDFSGTNNQVANVDEGDILKTDGKNIYTVNGRNINISSINPVDGTLTKVSKIQLSQLLTSVNQLNLYKNYLVVNGFGYSGYGSQTAIGIYDVSDTARPLLIRELAIDGDVQTTRMIDGVVYLVANYQNYQIYPYPQPMMYKTQNSTDSNSATSQTPEVTAQTKKSNLEKNLPKIYDSQNPKLSQTILPCEQIKYIRPIQNLSFMTILSLDLKNPRGDFEKEVVMGNSQNVYASDKNLYLAQTNYNYRNFGNGKQTTSIFKFNLNNSEIKFQTQGEVPGTVLNQFSMDEFEGNFRVATNEQENYQPSVFPNVFSSIAPINPTVTPQTNNLFVLDGNMKISGSVEDLAAGEKIYSVRFMGKKGYIVTFKKTDPLFTFDLSDPKNPKKVGELKIPGYSDYLHPISENLIIGVGKNALDAVDSFGDNQGFAWYQGLKLGLFDVSDLANPKEVGNVEIGDRGTDSVVLNDHKALLWDARNNLLTIPVTLMLIPEDQKTEQQKNIANGGASYPLYGQFKYQGSYVYEVNPNSGFKLKGRISHIETKAKEPIVDPNAGKKYDEFGQVINPTQTPNLKPTQNTQDTETDPNKVIRVDEKNKLNDGSNLFGQDKFLCFNRPNETRIYTKYTKEGLKVEEFIYPKKTGNIIDRKYDENGKLKSSEYLSSSNKEDKVMSKEELKRFEQDIDSGAFKCELNPVSQTPAMPVPSAQAGATSSIAIGEPYPGSGDYLYYISRQLYVNDYLVTFSPKQLQSNKISDLSLVNNVGF